MKILIQGEEAIAKMGDVLEHFDNENITGKSDNEMHYYAVELHPMCGYMGSFEFTIFDLVITNNNEGEKPFKMVAKEISYDGSIPSYLANQLENGDEDWNNIDVTCDFDIDMDNDGDESVETLYFATMEEVIQEIEETCWIDG